MTCCETGREEPLGIVLHGAIISKKVGIVNSYIYFGANVSPTTMAV
jgi:hypothetical protein